MSVFTILLPDEQEKMRAAGQAAAEVLDMITPYVVPGVSTDALNSRCHDYITEELQCIPAPLNYTTSADIPPFPKSICTSVNQVVCHGIPSPSKVLKDGDIVNIDITVIKDGFHGDTSKMFFVGKSKPYSKRLVEITQECLYRGIRVVKPGATLGDIGYSIQSFAEDSGYSVVREFCGHGIGKKFHTAPQVVHYGRPNSGAKLVEGMAFTIEPMINLGRRHVRILSDQWTVVTADRKLSAQWEHTILVTANGYEVLTLREEEDFV
ncbi:MAG: type I methionyl aminopeptidase [Gammaproteobacteria bacterium]|nr:type I methionyl aminopeptidase [Gammaproteobacteria bacterium]MYF38963.1 type I methionyl aminopeptidase [Gammaproteobacteria bacterium]